MWVLYGTYCFKVPSTSLTWMTFAIAAKPMPLSGPPPVLTLLHYIKIIESLEIWNGTNYWFVGFDICKTIIRYVDYRLLFIILPINHALVKINWCPASSIDLSWTNHIFYLSERCILDCSAMFSCETALNSYVGLVWDIWTQVGPWLPYPLLHSCRKFYLRLIRGRCCFGLRQAEPLPNLPLLSFSH